MENMKTQKKKIQKEVSANCLNNIADADIFAASFDRWVELQKSSTRV